MYTHDLVLRTVTDADLAEVARMWQFEQGAISLADAQAAIDRMQGNHARNAPGAIYHLCLAVFEKGKDRIIGWCGLDGLAVPGQTVIFYLIDKGYRNRGYATQCAARLLQYAFEEVGLASVHGGCAKGNVASYRVMQKAGMFPHAFEENGDPLFHIDAAAYFAGKNQHAS
ncbi:MAG: GNAT family N-acetyltransferase [Anaerolineae bacterium]